MDSSTKDNDYKGNFGVDLDHMKEMGVFDPKLEHTLDDFEKHHLNSTERIYFKLAGSESLNNGYFSPDQKLAQRGEHPSGAHIIISGEAIGKDPTGDYLLGAGSVIGLAEGLARIVYQWDVVAKTSITTKVIPLERALRDVRTLNAGLKGICRFTTMRILNLTNPPESLS